MREKDYDNEIDTFGLYLQEIGRTALLTREDEVALATAMQEGQAAHEIQSLGVEEPIVQFPEGYNETTLHKIVEAGESARARMIQSNLRLVVSVAKRYSWSDVDIADLVQDGNIGLMRAVETFDHTKGFKFSTYATWWIRQHIGRAIEKTGSMIRLPTSRREAISGYLKTRMEIEKEGKITEEIEIQRACSERLETSLEQVQNIALDYYRYGVVHSLDAPVGPEDSETTLYNVVSAQVPDIAEQYGDSEELQIILGLIDTELDEREAYIFRQRIFEAEGLKEIAGNLGMSKERVRQLENKAYRKIRNAVRKKELRPSANSDN